MTEEQIPQEKEKELTPMGILFIEFEKLSEPFSDAFKAHHLNNERQAIEEAFDKGGENELQVGVPDFVDGSDYFTTRYKQ